MRSGDVYSQMASNRTRAKPNEIRYLIFSNRKKFRKSTFAWHSPFFAKAKQAAMAPCHESVSRIEVQRVTLAIPQIVA